MFDEEIAAFPANPPRPVALLPGLRIGSSVSKASLALPLIFVAFFTLAPLSIFLSNPQARLALGSTETVSARVVALKAVGCRGEGHQITYVFLTSGQTEYRATTSLCPGSPYYDLNVGEHLPVKYLASNPSINRIADASEVNEPPMFIFFFFPLLGIFIFLPMISSQLAPILRARKLFRRGEITKGRVVFVKKKISSPWPGLYAPSPGEVFIAYKLASGLVGEASAWCSNDWLLNQLQQGTVVNIAVVPERPAAAVLLDAFVR